MEKNQASPYFDGSARGRAGKGGRKGIRSYRNARAAFPIVSHILITIRRIRDKYTTAPVRPLVILLLARRLGEDDPRANCRGVYRACLVNIIANRYRRSPRARVPDQGRERRCAMRVVPCAVAFLSTLARVVVSLLSAFSQPTSPTAPPHVAPPLPVAGPFLVVSAPPRVSSRR